MSPLTRVCETSAVLAALRHPTYEVIPIRGVDEGVAGLPADVRLTVTCSPVHGLDRTVEVAGRLAGMGFQVVPHLSARLVSTRAHLAKLVARLDEAGIREIFVIGGDIAQPAGEFTSSGELLEALAADGIPFDEVGIAGYPEGHPLISEDELTRGWRAKQRHATYAASQLCFDPDTIRAWAARVRRHGMTLPIEVGVPGVTPLWKLLRISAKVGVGESVRFLRSHHGFMTRMLTSPHTYRPDALVAGLESELADPDSGIRGFHIYTFNEVARTEEWRQDALDELLAA